MDLDSLEDLFKEFPLENETFMEIPHFHLDDSNNSKFALFLAFAIIAGMGILANLTGIALAVRRFRKNPRVSFLMNSLLVSNCFTILSLTMENTIATLKASYEFSNVTCKLYRFTWYSTIQISAWIIVTLLFETCRSIQLTNSKQKRSKTVWPLRLAVLGMVTSILLVNGHLFYTTGLIGMEFMPSQLCGYVTENPKLAQTATNIVHSLLYAAIPNAIILVLIFMLISILRLNELKRSQKRLAVMFALMSVLYLAMTLPNFIRLLIIYFLPHHYQSQLYLSCPIVEFSLRCLFLLNFCLNCPVFYYFKSRGCCYCSNRIAVHRYSNLRHRGVSESSKVTVINIVS